METTSFYQKVKGTVTNIENGFVYLEADEVMSKWDDKYKKHPSICSTAGRIENTIILQK